MHSALGSVTGSLENGVSRFSRLFSAHVNADPEAVEAALREAHRRLRFVFSEAGATISGASAIRT